MELYTGLALLSHLVRMVVLVAVVAIAVVLLIDWLARTRRLNPFHPLARAVRRSVDPMLLPIERRIVRAGGMPSSAPVWALVGAVIVGIVLVTGIDWLLGSLIAASAAIASGPAGVFILLVRITFGVLQLALFLVVIVSWLPISPYSPWVRWAFAITEPILRPLRQFLPSFGGLDLSPLVAYFLLGFLESAFLRLY